MPRQKPNKPYPNYPLTPHASGHFVKKIRGKTHYFGKDPDKALARFLDERDDLYAGRTPHRSDGVTTEFLVNAYCDYQAERVEAGEITQVTLNDYVNVGSHIVKHFGRKSDPQKWRPDDFRSFRSKVARKYHPTRLSKIVTVTRQIVKWGYESEFLETMPRFGPGFKVASNKQKRLSKSQQKLFSRDEIRELLEAADAKWRAIILLGINGGLGNSDIARLKLSDVGGEWLDFPRGKTGIDRRIPLWPETQAAIKAAIEARPQGGDLLFLSRHGGPLVSVGKSRTDLVAEGFARLAKKAGARDDEGKPTGCHRKGLGFYWLRHTFQTVGDNAKDPVAVSSIMGHADNTMAGQYRETIEDDRLRAVTEHIRSWLFGNVSE